MASAVASGRSRWTLWPAPAICSNRAPGIVSRSRRPSSLNFGSAAAGEDQRRHVEGREALPQRFLPARTRRAQARGQARRSVAEPVGALCRGRRQSREERIGQPFVDECLDADRFDARRQFLVGPATGAPLVVVIDSGRRTDEDQPLDELRMGERGVQRHSSAHRIADVRRPTAVANEMVGALPQVGAELAGAPVPGQIHGDHTGVRQPIAEQRGERLPRRRSLREAVDEDDPLRGRVGHVSVQASGSAIALAAIFRSTWE